jgi:hypothetical protein
MVILLVALNDFFINEYWWLLMAILLWLLVANPL